MDLYTLHGTTYQTENVLEGFESLIWTERYQDPGDFKLTSTLVGETLQRLPLDSLVCIGDSMEVCIVEEHEITEDDEGLAKIVVKGRTFDSFLENRIALDNSSFYNKIDPSTGTITEQIHGWHILASGFNDADAAVYIVTRHLVNPILTDLDSNPDVTDIVPNLIVHSLRSSNRQYYSRFLERTDLHTQVMNIIKASGDGVKNVRPTWGQTTMQMIFYSGVDRSADQTANGRIILDHGAGHLSNWSYFASSRNHKNAMYVYPKNSRGGLIRIGPGSVDPSLTGRQKKSLMIDATEITATSVADIAPSMNARASSEMGKRKIISMYDFQVSPNIPYVYGQDYNLGDIVTVSGPYGQRARMRVTEYIRTQDAEGSRGFPGLSLLT